MITVLGGFRITLQCILCSIALHVTYNGLGDVCKIIEVQNNYSEITRVIQCTKELYRYEYLL